MGILLNRQGWDAISAGITREEMAERMNLSLARVEGVLREEVKPDTMFIGKALDSFPMGFNDLFRVRDGLTDTPKRFL